MAPKPLPDHPLILEALLDEAKRYIGECEHVNNKLLLLERMKLDRDASLVRSPWKLDYQMAIIDDINKRIAASSCPPIALLDYIEGDILADLTDSSLQMKREGIDPHSNPWMLTLYNHQRTLDRVRVLYRNIIAKLENQKAASPIAPLIPETPRSRRPIQGGHSPNSPSAFRSEASVARATARLTPAVMKAYQSYMQAMEEDPSLNTDNHVYNYIKNNNCEIYEDELPDYQTWVRYVREGRKLRGTQKNHPRAGRAHGKSIIRQDEME